MGDPCIIGEYCSTHGFIHGAEAEELRERLEELLPDLNTSARRKIQHVLDDVDARDSCAWVEVKRRLEAEGESDAR